MKKILFVALLATVATFGQTAGVKFNALIVNPNSDSLVIHNKEFKITLKGQNGKFSGNLNAPKGFYQLFDGSQFAFLYFNDGFDLTLNADGKRMGETISFSGKGAAENNYLLQKRAIDNKLKQSFGGTLPDDAQLQQVLDKRLSDAKVMLASGGYEPDFAPLMIAQYEEENERIKADLTAVRAKENGLASLKNTPAPQFDFENHKGGKTKLSTLKGKVVYIDIWATWCAPCRAEIPYLKQLEQDFKGKNIAFVSISIDELKDHDKWKKLVTDQQLQGIQLMADKAWQSAWVKHFKVEGIPRFIIINKEGIIANPDAPRPSSSEIATILNELLK